VVLRVVPTRRILSFVFALTAITVAEAAPAVGAPPPAHIVSFQAVPRELGPDGGLLVIQADVRNALECRLKLVSDQHFAVVYSHSPSYGCQSGYFSPHVQVGANPSSVSRTIMFEVIVSNATSKAVARVPVRIAAQTSVESADRD
jgi:hypothetical protein